MIDDPARLAARGAALLQGRLARFRAVAGGDLSAVVALTLADGREAIVKGGPSPATEAAMLRAIATAGAPAPAVYAHDADILVIEHLDSAGGSAQGWQDLGHALAVLHASQGLRYGWDRDYAFGAVAIVNDWSDDWCEFWASRRLLNQLPYVAADVGRRIERLAGVLNDRVPAHPPPSLLHGDLWSGNILFSGRRVSGLIDPACYYGDAEVDFAMLQLFSQPAPELFNAYGGLRPGYRERLPVYQLWPALVHLRLFGNSYRALVERLLVDAGV